jgi:hypothetical protein
MQGALTQIAPAPGTAQTRFSMPKPSRPGGVKPVSISGDVAGVPPSLTATLLSIGAIWVASDVGYYVLLPALGYRSSYNEGSVAAALYYVFWVGVAVIACWPRYATWPHYARWATFENRLVSIVVWSLAFAGSVLFVAYVLPALPPFDPRAGFTPPELPLATPWYFLPKSVEILLQQLLVVALVLTLAAAEFSLRRISLVCAALFGGAHVLLAFGDVPWGYVARFSILAAVFGLVFPYLILRVPNGFAYSYVVHWAYYATTLLMARTFGSGGVLNAVKPLLGGGS